MIKKLFNIIILIKNSFLLKSFFWAKLLFKYNIPIRFVKPRMGRLYIKDLDISIDINKHEYFLKNFFYTIDLKTKLDAKYYLSDKNEIIVEINNIKHILQTAEELFILNEIYIEKIYDFLTQEPVLIMDIGMNVGYASLFFAAKNNINVISFEPFPKTYKQAMRNFELNKDLARKIKAYNFGLGSKDKELNVDYCSDLKGNMSIYGLNENAIKYGKHFTKEKIQVRNINDIFEKISSIKDYENLFMKIDCEGAEYEIFEALNSSNYLGRFKVIFMELHGSEQQRLTLIKMLLNNNYILHTKYENEMVTIIVAFK